MAENYRKKPVIREARSAADFDAIVGLQREAWNVSDVDVVGPLQLRATQHAGACVLVAEDADDHGGIVGFAYAFPAYRNGRAWWHSDMTAVRPAHRSRGVGSLLKWAQRDRALAAGLDRITWTFDPMQARNAHLNLNLLGATCREYVPNLYGVTSSDLHHGLPTDRLVAEWDLASPRVAALALGRPLDAPTPSDVERVEIPEDWNTMVAAHPDGARMRQREAARAFGDAFGRGLRAFAFDRDRTAYLLASH